ncbi:MAG: hypothetical protein EOP32_31940 [Rhodococcus sp. (in: high G+C Gram-positive bacteria)]|nr:MAG: hypothetical protein EOP32_31940 [Rhodococcus sp. (in: high G+C Gram-positive bacteria)]
MIRHVTTYNTDSPQNATRKCKARFAFVGFAALAITLGASVATAAARPAPILPGDASDQPSGGEGDAVLRTYGRGNSGIAGQDADCNIRLDEINGTKDLKAQTDLANAANQAGCKIFITHE